jgi:hypothetical protein
VGGDASQAEGWTETQGLTAVLGAWSVSAHDLVPVPVCVKNFAERRVNLGYE